MTAIQGREQIRDLEDGLTPANFSGMTRIYGLLFLGILAILVSCAKPPGFQAEKYDFTRVENESGGTHSKQTQEEGTIVRNSSRIEFKPLHSDWKQEELTLKAKVKVGEKSYGDVEFRGKKVDSKILLTPVDKDLSDKFKAQAICTSEAGCEDFFVDVFYNENKVLYHDQVLATPKEEFVPSKPAAPSATSTTIRSSPTSAGPPVATPAKEDFVIQDEIPQEAIENSGYVGTSDAEALQAFKIQPAAKAPAKPTEKSAEKDKAPPRQPPTQPTKSADDTGKTSGTQEPTGASTTLDRYRIRDQAIGKPDQGRLTRATDLMKLSALPGMFFTIKPGEKSYFGIFDVGVVLQELGKYLQTILPGRKLTVTEISDMNGGPLRYRIGRRTFLHASHQNGQDVDIRYLRHDESRPSDVVENGILSRNFLASQQWSLFKKAFATNKVEMIFVDSVIKKSMCEEARRSNDYRNGQSGAAAEILRRLYVVPGHDHHFHIRVRCSDDHPQCRRINYKRMSVGC